MKENCSLGPQLSNYSQQQAPEKATVFANGTRAALEHFHDRPSHLLASDPAIPRHAAFLGVVFSFGSFCAGTLSGL